MNRTTLKPSVHSLATRLAVGACALLLAGCSGGAVSSDVATGSEAQAKAAQLNTELAKAGLPDVAPATAGALYGVDGGISCLNAAQIQHQLGLAQFGNASGNLRRIIIDPSLVAYDRAVIATYCPDALADYEAEVAGLTTASTIP